MPLFLPPSASSLPPTLFFVAILAVGSFGCADEESRRGRERPQPAVEVVQARVGALPLEERLSGVVRAENQVAVRAEISALVTEVLVRTGDAVEAGEALVRLDAQGPRERLRQGEAAVRLAAAQAAEAEARVVELVAQVSRTRALADDDLVSELALETQEARLEAARAAAAQAAARVDEARATAEERRADLAKTVVRAPVEGRVGRRRVEVGSQVDSSTLLFELGSLDNLVVEVPLTEEMLTVLREGQSALVRPSDGGEPIRARLDRVSPFLSAGSFSTTGEIDLGDAGARLRPGTFVTVDILYGESERATLVPISALWEDPRTGMLGLYVVGEDPSAGPSSASTGVSSGALPAASSARETDGYASDIDRDVVFQPV
ncbi:MAG: efflux RND transporter periplasmic adaptor subunit, partial [Acidobacteriota bacterium]